MFSRQTMDGHAHKNVAVFLCLLLAVIHLGCQSGSDGGGNGDELSAFEPEAGVVHLLTEVPEDWYDSGLRLMEFWNTW